MYRAHSFAVAFLLDCRTAVQNRQQVNKKIFYIKPRAKLAIKLNSSIQYIRLQYTNH